MLIMVCFLSAGLQEHLWELMRVCEGILLEVSLGIPVRVRERKGGERDHFRIARAEKYKFPPRSWGKRSMIE